MLNRMKHARSLAIIALFALASCKKDGDTQSSGPLQSLYRTYKDGQIEECMLDGKPVYCAVRNACDAGSAIYDSKGKQIGSCNYAWGAVDAVCSRLQSCEVVYCGKAAYRASLLWISTDSANNNRTAP